MADERIDTAIHELLEERGWFTSQQLARRLGISRQAVHRHLRRRLADRRLIAEGSTHTSRYLPGGDVRSGGTALVSERVRERVPRDLVPLCPIDKSRRFALEGLNEETAWLEMRAREPALGGGDVRAAENALAYVVAELVNNAIDHSNGQWVEVELWLDPKGERPTFRGTVRDDGIGAFESIRSALHLTDAIEALQELSKGKLTTAPEAHSGEGLFFSSRAVDTFDLEANGLCWAVDAERGDQTLAEISTVPGTTVRFAVDARTDRALDDVFARYTTDFEFDTTRCIVRLFEHGVRFVSRSEAKRLVRRLDRFREVVVDFDGVEMVGQGFVDELFRVWARAHPEVRLVPTNMNRSVEFMVRRGLPGPSKRL